MHSSTVIPVYMVLVACAIFVTSDNTFVLRLSSVGMALCALDDPTETLPTSSFNSTPSCIPDDVKCGWMCSKDPNCTSYNYRIRSKVCELFNCRPHNFTTVADCQHFGKSTRAAACGTNTSTSPMQTMSTSTSASTTTQQPTTFTAAPATGPTGLLYPTFGLYPPNNNSWLMQNRVENISTYFNRSWSEYKNGFSDPSGNYWLGNDEINQITSVTYPKSCGLYILLFMTSGVVEYAIYQPFAIDTEARNYAITDLTKSATGNVTHDGLPGRKGKSFSTFDNDNDSDPAKNCAVIFGGGNWYGAENNIGKCGFTNFNGMADGFEWYESVEKPLSRSQLWLTC